MRARGNWRVWFSLVAIPWALWFTLSAWAAVNRCEDVMGYSRDLPPPDCAFWWPRLGWPAFLPFALLGLAVWIAPIARRIGRRE